MANKKVCSKNLNIDGKLYSYADYVFFTLSRNNELIKVRHYSDLLKTGAKGSSSRYIGDRSKGSIHPYYVTDDVHAARVVAITKKSLSIAGKSASLGALHSFAKSILEYDVFSDESGVSRDALSDLVCIAGSTCDARRARVSERQASMFLTNEGGYAHPRTPLEELTILAQSNRSSGTYYSSAYTDNTRRRELVETLTETNPSALLELVTSLRQKDGLRSSAIMISVDAIVSGHPQGRALLSLSLVRPDEPGLALSYYISEYTLPGQSSKSIPSALKKGVRDAAVRLYSDESAAKFDRKRTIAVSDRSSKVKPLSFRDVILLTGPKVDVHSVQYDLFQDLIKGTHSTPLRSLKRHLLNIRHDDRLATLSAEAALSVQALRAGNRHTSDYSKLPWEFLTSLVTSRKESATTQKSALALANSNLHNYITSPEQVSIRNQERRLRTRLRDARNQYTPALISSQPQMSRSSSSNPLARKEANIELKAYRESSEYVEYISKRATLRDAVTRARNNMLRSEITPGVIPKEVYEITVPFMSASQIFSLLGSIERSGVDPVILEHVQSVIENTDSIRIPDVLRTVRGLSMGSLRASLLAPSPTGEDQVGTIRRISSASDQVGNLNWTKGKPSRWENSFSTNIANRLGNVMPDTKEKKLLILVDGSGSMYGEVSMRVNDKRSSGYSSLSCAEVAAFAASAIRSNCASSSEVVVYSSVAASELMGPPGGSVLEQTRDIVNAIHGGCTETSQVLEKYYKDHDYVVVLTDEQSSDQLSPSSRLHDVPVLTVNFAGHSGALSASVKHSVVSGWSESVFAAVNAMATR